MVSNSWGGKKVALTGASIGQLGTAMAQYELRKVLSFVGANIMPQPEFMLSFADKQFDESSKFVAKEEPFAVDFMNIFAKFVAK
jgi:chromate reductase